jgi:rare lipoprotein A (peptidoglycan hydrolase)
MLQIRKSTGNGASAVTGDNVKTTMNSNLLKMFLFTVCLFVLAIYCYNPRNIRSEIAENSVKRKDLKKTEESTRDVFWGTASYYGEEFEGRRTANGEIYNGNLLTAAHQTLPFGTICRVTNLENKNEVVVRINDRGPFIKNRMIDLSYAAAKKIGGLEKGVIDVKIEILKYP